MSRRSQVKQYTSDYHGDNAVGSETIPHIRLIERRRESPLWSEIEDDLHCIGPFSATAD